MIDPNTYDYKTKGIQPGQPQTPPVQMGQPQLPPVQAGQPQVPPVQQGTPQVPPVQAGQPQTPYNNIQAGTNAGQQSWSAPGGATRIDPNTWSAWGGNSDYYPTQEWYRNPNWGGHIAWNPYWGYQDWPTITEMYEKAGTGNILPKEFRNAEYTGWSQNRGNEYQENGPWQSYTWGRIGDPGGEQPGTPDWPFGGWGDGTEGGGYITGGDTIQPGAYQYPEQWGTASELYNQLAANPTAIPEQWRTASNTMTNMAQNGNPVSQNSWYQQAQAQAQRDIEDQIYQAAEQAGLRGSRWSTPMGRTAQDIAGRTMGQVGLEWTDREMSALENAQNRMLQSSSQLQNLGAGYAGLEEAAKNRGMQAAGGLASLGQQYNDAPQQWAQQMYGMGQGMTNQYNTALGNQYQDFLRTAGENNPYMQQLFSYLGMDPQSGYQQYGQSGLSQLLGTAGPLAGLCMAVSSRKYKDDIEVVSEAEEDELGSRMLETGLFEYRYKHEPKGERHVGMITEESPEEVSVLNRNAVGLYEYIGALHATIKSLSRRLGKMEAQAIRGL